MDNHNFIRMFLLDGITYVVTGRPGKYKQSTGTPQYFLQVWKMRTPTKGSLYQPTIKGWAVPSLNGYTVRTMNLDVAYERFIKDFKAHEAKK